MKTVRLYQLVFFGWLIRAISSLLSPSFSTPSSPIPTAQTVLPYCQTELEQLTNATKITIHRQRLETALTCAHNPATLKTLMRLACKLAIYCTERIDFNSNFYDDRVANILSFEERTEQWLKKLEYHRCDPHERMFENSLRWLITFVYNLDTLNYQGRTTQTQLKKLGPTVVKPLTLYMYELGTTPHSPTNTLWTTENTRAFLHDHINRLLSVIAYLPHTPTAGQNKIIRASCRELVNLLKTTQAHAAIKTIGARKGRENSRNYLARAYNWYDRIVVA